MQSAKKIEICSVNVIVTVVFADCTFLSVLFDLE